MLAPGVTANARPQVEGEKDAYATERSKPREAYSMGCR